MRSINTLHVTASILLGHLYPGKDLRHTLLTEYYYAIRELGVKGSTPLKDLLPTLPQDVQVLTAKALLYTPATKLGFFGGTTLAPELLKAADAWDNMPFDEHCNDETTFAKVLAKKLNLNVLTEPAKYSTRIKPNKLLKKALSYLDKNPHITAFSINSQALQLGRLVKGLLSLASFTIPLDRMGKPEYHANLLKNCLLTAEVGLPQDLIKDIRIATQNLRCFLPSGIIYSLLYQTSLGTNLVINLESLGFLLGYKGAQTARFSYIRKFSKEVGMVLSEKYNLHYERLCDVVQHGKDPYHVFNVADTGLLKEDKTPVFVQEEYDVRNLLKHNNPFASAVVPFENTTQKVLGKSRGTYILDRNLLTYNMLYYPTTIHYTFPYEVRFLTPRAALTRSLKISIFTRKQHQQRAYASLVDMNPVTKPDPNTKPRAKDNRWLPIFDDYLATDFDPKKLAKVMRKDKILYYSVVKKLRRLAKYLTKTHKTVFDLIDQSATATAYEGTKAEECAGDWDKDKYEYLFIEVCRAWATKGLVLDLPVKVRVKKLAEPGKKERLVCREPCLMAIFDALSNKVWQVITQSINIKLGYPLSNYLPGMAVPLRTMERFRDAMEGQDISLLNMDVKSCFDSINLKHENFLARIEKSSVLVEELAGKAAADFTRKLFKNYLHDSITQGKIKFTKSTGKGQKGLKLPKVGTLPTGFVLAPALWTHLALPAVYSTSKLVQSKKLLAMDLCGDDLVVVAARNLPQELKDETCAPWFELANDLSLKFHFFKNYKDKTVHFNAKWNHLFEDKSEQNVTSAWIDSFPAYSIPIFHAGTLLADKHYIETVTSYSAEKAEGKFYSSLGKRKRDKQANFIPNSAAIQMSQHPALVNRLRAYAPANRLRDQAVMESEGTRWLTGAQGCVMTFFNKSTKVVLNGECISRQKAFFIQHPVHGVIPCKYVNEVSRNLESESLGPFTSTLTMSLEEARAYKDGLRIELASFGHQKTSPQDTEHPARGARVAKVPTEATPLSLQGQQNAFPNFSAFSYPKEMTH